jgi:hypothetical protein
VRSAALVGRNSSFRKAPQDREKTLARVDKVSSKRFRNVRIGSFATELGKRQVRVSSAMPRWRPNSASRRNEAMGQQRKWALVTPCTSNSVPLGRGAPYKVEGESHCGG